MKEADDRAGKKPKDNLKDREEAKRYRLKNGNPACDLQALPRCQAKAKSTGKRCGKPALAGKRVCERHGGRSPGAPRGNRNAERSGLYSREARTERERSRKMLQDFQEILAEIAK